MPSFPCKQWIIIDAKCFKENLLGIWPFSAFMPLSFAPSGSKETCMNSQLATASQPMRNKWGNIFKFQGNTLPCSIQNTFTEWLKNARSHGNTGGGFHERGAMPGLTVQFHNHLLNDYWIPGTVLSWGAGGGRNQDAYPMIPAPKGIIYSWGIGIHTVTYFLFHFHSNV